MPPDRSELHAFAVEPLGSQHDRERFDCGIPALNDYLRKQAHQGLTVTPSSQRRLLAAWLSTPAIAARDLESDFSWTP